MKPPRATTDANGTNAPASSQVADARDEQPGAGADPAPAEESVEALQEALEATRRRLQQRLSEEIDRQRAESESLKQLCEQLRAEASTIEEQAKEAAARIVAEAKQNEAQMLGRAQETVDTVLTRLRDRAGSFLERAASEISAVQEAIAAAGGPAASQTGSGAPTASAVDPADERVVARLVVRPALTPEERARFKAQIESLPGVDAALFGAVEDESFEMLIAHEHSTNVLDGLLAIAPEEIALTAQREGVLELQVTGVKWLEASDEVASNPA